MCAFFFLLKPRTQQNLFCKRLRIYIDINVVFYISGNERVVATTKYRKNCFYVLSRQT